MRIITGKYKGRILKVPHNIRPTEDRVRKAFFDIMGDMQGLSFLELFAGSGAMAMEALSQGARYVVMAENQRHCVKAIEENLAMLALPEPPAGPAVKVIPADALKALALISKAKQRFEVVFLDPPYYKDLAEKTLQSLGNYDILQLSGYAVVQHFKKDLLPERANDLVFFRQERYGDSALSFYQKRVEPLSSVEPNYVQKSDLPGNL